MDMSKAVFVIDPYKKPENVWMSLVMKCSCVNPIVLWTQIRQARVWLLPLWRWERPALTDIVTWAASVQSRLPVTQMTKQNDTWVPKMTTYIRTILLVTDLCVCVALLELVHGAGPDCRERPHRTLISVITISIPIGLNVRNMLYSEAINHRYEFTSQSIKSPALKVTREDRNE